MVGAGPMKEEISGRVSALGRKDVILCPFRQADELSSYYAFASALVLPSLSEPWGLVVNEAMASGLPILASERCGCVMELVFPGINGYIFDPLRVESLVEVMVRVSSSNIDRLTMGAASVRIIGNFTPETWAASLADCIAVTLERKWRST
jgi:glycosyltransferase involved in cell wall biosynthesis